MRRGYRVHFHVLHILAMLLVVCLRKNRCAVTPSDVSSEITDIL